ncbi:MAG: universal stress protein [Saprospiraceae bacterium]|nr:universal stress protein [Saprospiraceae bacterium]
MRKILVPTDFSPCAASATEIGKWIAKKTHAELTFLHGMRMPVDWVNLPKRLEDTYPEIKAQIGAAHQHLDDLVRDAGQQGIKAEKSLAFLEGFETVANTVLDHDNDLIVIGSHGHTGFKKFALGSHTEKIMRQAHAPVLACKKPGAEIRFNTLVFASGLEEDTHPAFDLLIKFAENIGAENLYFVEVTTPYNFKPTGEVMANIRAFVEVHPFKTISVHNYAHYSIEEGILAFAHSVGADLIGIANHGRTGLGGIFVESIPENLLRYGDLPVLSIRV